MPRPSKFRCIEKRAIANLYKPQGIPAINLEVVIITEVELEAVRLADYKDMEHEEASMLMNISRPTFSRILSGARKKIAEALVEGKALKIEGGNFVVKSAKCTSSDSKNREEDLRMRCGRRKGRRCMDSCIYNERNILDIKEK